MSLKVTTILSATAIAVCASLLAAAPADARDWRLSVQRHYKAADDAKYTPKGDNPQWDFDLNTVVNDMEWRARTAAMLRNLPKPGQRPDAVEAVEAEQLADRPEQPTFRFAF